jgi:hypothetical protein
MTEDREVSPTPVDRYECYHDGCKSFVKASTKIYVKHSYATFELIDALLLTRKAESLADLSLSCVFRRLQVECLRGATRYKTRETAVNQALHPTNPAIKTNRSRRRP